MCSDWNSDLQASSGLLRSVLDSLTEQIAVIDDSGKIEWVNRAWIEFSEQNGGIAKKVGPGVNYLQVCRQSAASGDADAFVAHDGIREVIEQRRPLFYFEYACHSPQQQRWFMMWTKALEWDGPSRFVIQHQNITERKSAEEQLLRGQRIQAIGALAGGVAHDFNNLMAVIIGNAEALGDMVAGNDSAKLCLEEITWAIDRGSNLTNRLLAFSRKQTLAPVATDVNKLIEGLADMLDRTLGETIDLRIEFAPDLWAVTIDPGQLEQALVNLTVNARDAMPSGGRLAVVTANVVLDDTQTQQYEEIEAGDYVRITVSDSGIGIPPELLGKAVEPFFTTKEVGERNGLGLSMVYGFVKQSKGHMTIASEIDKGTTVNLFLPRCHEAAPQGEDEEDAAKPEGRSQSILVIEDNPKVRRVAVNILRGQGYNVVEAQDGEGATRHLKSGKTFVLLFTDVVLPGGMNGVEIAELAKQIQPNINVLYTTGYTEDSVIQKDQLKVGVNLIRKPYRRAQLLEMVDAILSAESR